MFTTRIEELKLGLEKYKDIKQSKKIDLQTKVKSLNKNSTGDESQEETSNEFIDESTIQMLVSHYQLKKIGNTYFAPEEDKDYCQNGICEIVGLRYYEQQDAVDQTELNNVFNEFKRETQSEIMKEVLHEMQSKHGNYDEEGSTACITVSWTEEKNNIKKLKLCNANVGDSASFLVIVDEKNAIVTANKINPIHDGKLVHTVIRNKLKMRHTLRMTRSIGDKRYELHGLIHHPEITFFEVDLDEGQRAFIVTACDGLTERMHPAKDSKQKKSEFEEQEIGTCVATTIDDCKSKNIESEIAFRLTEKAVNTGSTDNISIIVKEVTHQKNPHIGAVFDGHGGNKVSKALGKHTIPLFKDLIELKNLLKNPLNQVKQNHERSSKKEMLDPLVDKIFSLNRRGGQSEKLYALTKIYFALKKLNLSDPSAVTTYHELIIKNLKNFESFSSRLGKFGAWIKQSIFKTVYTETISDTRLLAGKLLDWVENNALPKQRIIDKIRQNISF